MNMILKVYQNGKKINEIRSNDKGDIYEHVARIYRTKLHKLAECVLITTCDNELQHAEIHYTLKLTNYTLKLTKFAYKYDFEGVLL